MKRYRLQEDGSVVSPNPPKIRPKTIKVKHGPLIGETTARFTTDTKLSMENAILGASAQSGRFAFTGRDDEAAPVLKSRKMHVSKISEVRVDEAQKLMSKSIADLTAHVFRQIEHEAMKFLDAGYTPDQLVLTVHNDPRNMQTVYTIGAADAAVSVISDPSSTRR